MTQPNNQSYTRIVTGVWRTDNSVTECEYREVGKLLCDMAPRDLALRVVRLQAKLDQQTAPRGMMRDPARGLP